MELVSLKYLKAMDEDTPPPSPGAPVFDDDDMGNEPPPPPASGVVVPLTKEAIEKYLRSPSFRAPLLYLRSTLHRNRLRQRQRDKNRSSHREREVDQTDRLAVRKAGRLIPSLPLAVVN